MFLALAPGNFQKPLKTMTDRERMLHFLVVIYTTVSILPNQKCCIKALPYIYLRLANRVASIIMTVLPTV